MLTPEQRSIRARIAASTRWAAEDGQANGRRGQKGLRDKYVREAREKFPGLPEDQIQRRAAHALRAHMLQMALKSSKARETRRTADGPAG
jgi:hypothetical protein